MGVRPSISKDAFLARSDNAIDDWCQQIRMMKISTLDDFDGAVRGPRRSHQKLGRVP